MCTSFCYSTDKCTGRWCCENTLKDGLSDPRGSLANKIPSRAIAQANQEVHQDGHHSEDAPNQASKA